MEVDFEQGHRLLIAVAVGVPLTAAVTETLTSPGYWTGACLVTGFERSGAAASRVLALPPPGVSPHRKTRLQSQLSLHFHAVAAAQQPMHWWRVRACASRGSWRPSSPSCAVAASSATSACSSGMPLEPLLPCSRTRTARTCGQPSSTFCTRRTFSPAGPKLGNNCTWCIPALLAMMNSYVASLQRPQSERLAGS
eukprot:CAMPEP_0181413570 /NCGR_PEP_ID=MMETSP1110-20121109/9043_1 /TAXON_ID=174948 /ORGANISM="Symbiodinium sp., Strain CCMP421" /LENGTH=194 /DNA_ID=CAMNT_0023536393 /DNA_START=497 /DNA_END=1082 /DNA_ORIENTATION=+